MRRWMGWAGVVCALAVAAPRAWADAPPRLFPLESYKPNYFLATWDFEPHADREDKELKFQISFKKRLFDSTPLYLAYTQQAEWQFFDDHNSRPFRTQTHNPEIFLDTDLDPLLGGKPGLRVGLEHESNGQPTADSRSWNRAYLLPRITFPDLENLSIAAKAWWRFPESKKKSPTDPNGDDNPDIEKYLGNGELYLSQVSQGSTDALPYRRVSVMLRRGTMAGTGTIQVDADYDLHAMWSFFNEGIYLHLQYFYGYGESLIDYNHLVKKWGLGFSFY